MICPTQNIPELLNDIERQQKSDQYTIGRYDQQHRIWNDEKPRYWQQAEKFKQLVREQRVTERDYMSMFLTVAIIDAMVLGI